MRWGVRLRALFELNAVAAARQLQPLRVRCWHLPALALPPFHPALTRFHRYTLDQPPEGWAFATGHICEALLREHLPPGGPGAVAAVCGPPGMVKFACLPNLAALGYSETSIIQF